ncbi:hypothetical protein SASPL_155035 [Salvia splendens]|uniref:Pectinesterase inhibitor domain-containing protein n=1 Tax=Salvia splendens TaxID=180675 RepID=A0A8X8YZT9_SALSN|nr:pectinesterase inhibitor-like [Salvia splendens]KAG6386144.1 hypothetical protein SASPL_155035 [Salvia splendens]
MATFSSLSLILILSLTAGDILRRGDAAAAAISTVCAKTRQPSLCVNLLKSSDTRSATANLAVLAQIAIDAATDSAGGVKIRAHNLFLSARNPNLKSIYGNCQNLYAKGLDQLFIAPEYLQNRNYGKLVAAAAVVGGGARGCATAAAKDAALKQGNDDTAVLADAVGVIARLL